MSDLELARRSKNAEEICQDLSDLSLNDINQIVIELEEARKLAEWFKVTERGRNMTMHLDKAIKNLAGIQAYLESYQT